MVVIICTTCFLKLDEVAPQVGADVIRNHPPSRGCREEFLEFIKNEASVFEEWRYAYEKEFLVSSPDILLMLADAFRKTVRKLHPDLRSAGIGLALVPFAPSMR